MGISDFSAFYVAGETAWQGGDIYEVSRDSFYYIYPPLFSIFMIPFSWLSFNTAHLLWECLGILFLGLAVFTGVDLTGEKKWKWYYLLPVIIAIQFVTATLKWAQVNFLILFLILKGFKLSREKKEFWGGILIALAISIKVIPAIMGLYFIIKKKKMVLWGILSGLLFFLLLIPTVIFGPYRNMRLLSKWYSRIISPYVMELEIERDYSLQNYRVDNQSASAALHRFFDRKTKLWLFSENKFLIYHLGEKKIKTILLIFNIGLLILIIFSLFKKSKKNCTMITNLEFSLPLLTIPFFTGVSWRHHYILTIFPLISAIVYLKKSERNSKGRFYILSSIIVFTLFAYLTDNFFLGQRAYLFQGYSLIFLGNFTLLLAFLIVIIMEKKKIH